MSSNRTTELAGTLLIATFSEFGRRAQENGSRGTDHPRGTNPTRFAREDWTLAIDPCDRASPPAQLASPELGRPAPLVASSDRIGLFGGTNGVVGSFIETEPSRSLPHGARSLAAAGREGRGPALVAYRLGRGMVIRIGTPGWARLLDSSPEVAAVTERAWALISR